MSTDILGLLVVITIAIDFLMIYLINEGKT